MKKIIIGIHGLKNKPAENLLKKWWKESILEGLAVNGYGWKDFNFELVYWADLNYDSPLDPGIQDENSPYYLRFPYAASESGIKAEEVDRKKISSRIETGIDNLILKGNEIKGFEFIADLAIKKMFIDLDIYYRGNCVMKPDRPARDEFRGRLADMLNKYRRYRIMLIAHSMGSLIAYDTLMSSSPRSRVHCFATLGSPLGLPVLINKILREHYSGKSSIPSPFTPDAVKESWINFTDPSDRVALVPKLSDKYMPNRKGVRPQDFIVKNNYNYDGNINPHKIYGYLRCPEVSEAVNSFLQKEGFAGKFFRKADPRKLFFKNKPEKS